MYDQIFDDFNIIKQHSERNGNNQFEESAVFELLESLYPSHGSAQAVQTIICMLDAQRVRDSKSLMGNSKGELDNKKLSNDNENDNDIIEIEVPKKIHPLIDLTENSTESEETVIIEKSENKSNVENIEINSDSNIEMYDSDTSCHGIHSFSDSDVSNHFNEDSNLTTDNLSRSNSEKQLLNYLAILDQPNQMNQQEEQSYNDSLDVSEMLEENNNDPNNNFNEENMAVNHTVNNYSSSMDILNDNEPPNSDKALDNLFNELFDSGVFPGCSKELKPNAELNVANKTVSNYNFINPVAGCSKDINISQNIGLIGVNDDSMKKDITCIQEIIPWATSEEIHFVLMKYNNLPDRKQLTLLNLMKKESKRIKSQAVKRKANNSPEIERKTLKLDNMFEIDGQLDVHPKLQFDNILSNESCNDSLSSKRSEYIEPYFKINQNLNTSNKFEFSRASLENKEINFNSNLNSSSNLLNSNTQIFSKTSCNIPTVNHTSKKERNETVVSGLLQEQNNLETLHRKNLNDKFTLAPSTNFLKQPVTPSFSSINDFQHLASGNSIDLKSTKNTTIQEAANHFKDLPILDGFSQNFKSRTVIQPPKLLLQNAQTVINPIMAAKSNFIRPSILKPKDNTLERLYHVHAARSKHYIPPPLSACRKQLPSSNFIHIQLPRTTTIEDQADKNSLIRMENELKLKKQNNSQNIKRPIDVLLYKSEKSETIAEPSLKIQTKPLHNDTVAQPGISGMNSIVSSTSTSIPHQSIYNKLRSIFPDVESSYIKNICINPPNITNTNDKTYILNALIEHLLNEGSNHLRPVEYIIDQPDITSVSIDEKYEYLLGIFPDADPTYIRDFVVKNPSEQDFQEFIQQKLESRNYPTKEQYMAKIKITEQIKQYTTELNIEKFLELFPDPLEHFENTSRKCLYQPIAMEFLKSLFVKNKVTTITQRYKSNNYNLSLTAKNLTEIGSDMKSKRVSVEMPTEDIPLLQEIAFIKNKQNILNYLNMLKNKEEQLFKELKEQNLLLTCQCCYNDECMPTKSSECNEGHIFCHECIIRGTESALADAEFHVRCFTDCTSEFSLATLQKVLPPTKFSALLQKRQTAEVIAAGVDGLVSCPFCHFASIPPPEDKVFKCLNPDCMKETCKMCKELNHVPLKCDEVIKTDRARHMLEEKMTEALVRTCYKCRKQFYKEDGCNKMQCPCGALMCYLCSKPIKGYNHFNAQGGANTHLCPLWSDDRFLNAKAVIQVAEDVKKTLLKNNPNLKIDTDSLLPKIPPKTRGPHDDIPNANQLPERILKIAHGGRR